MKNPFKRQKSEPAAVRAFRVGDAIRAKEGVHYPEVTELDIGGWQGRIVDVSQLVDDPPVVGLKWDSLALRSLPAWLIEESEEEGLSWTTLYLYASEVEAWPARDAEAAADAIARELHDRHRWSYLGEEGRRINAVLAGAGDDRCAQFEAWERYLKQTLKFPFEAKVAEVRGGSSLRYGDILKVLQLEIVDDDYGIVVHCRQRRRVLDFPLADLEVTNHQSVNYTPVQDYGFWYANR